MGKSAPTAPAAPDPNAVAAAQTQSNEATAQFNANLNHQNTVTPYGSQTWGATGNPASPTWTQTITPSAAEQPIVNDTLAGQQIYGNTALNELGQAQNTLSTPINNGMYSGLADEGVGSLASLAANPMSDNGQQAEQNSMNAALSRLLPQEQMEQGDMQSQLLGQGITQGSAAYNNATRQFGQQQNDLMLQATAQAPQYAAQDIANSESLRNQQATEAGNLISGTGSALQQQTALRDQPINEASALLSGSQVQTPQLSSYQSQANAAPTDVIGANQLSYGVQEQNYQQQLAQQNAQMGGLYGLLGTGALGASMYFSDRRMKKDIHHVGKTPAGTPISTFKYKGDPAKQTHVGVIAQELMKRQPGAVQKTPSGMYAVDYARVR